MCMFTIAFSYVVGRAHIYVAILLVTSVLVVLVISNEIYIVTR